ncbi:hypothetical protein ACEWY4_019131 [Coilia grayii]|uniref:Cadherin domain-containing protein n=1 Tax=Coilia grayii TaxID=363190 RepID=A0ABD1JF73_9TELE
MFVSDPSGPYSASPCRELRVLAQGVPSLGSRCEGPHHWQWSVIYEPAWTELHSNSDKGDGSVRYILSGEGAGSIFIIDETTGDIHATKSLDRERKTHYVLHAQAIDRHTKKPLEPESEFIIKVQDINDNAPKFPDGPFTTSVAEMSEVVSRGIPQSVRRSLFSALSSEKPSGSTVEREKETDGERERAGGEKKEGRKGGVESLHMMRTAVAVALRPVLRGPSA